jgi:LAO/AO transport system kinase
MRQSAPRNAGRPSEEKPAEQADAGGSGSSGRASAAGTSGESPPGARTLDKGTAAQSPTVPVETLAAGVRAGDRRALAKAITLVESTRTDHQAAAQRLLELLLPATGRAVRVGITGVPGVGKSTFIEAFGLFLIAQGHRVAVLAVDPSSARSGGSILGDKTRMARLSAAPEAFIRPSPSAGSLGGVTRRTREALLVCEAAGYDVVLVETVGVGQSEVAVASMVDFFLVLMLAGAGDELQGIKKGILELADALAVNKADGDNVRKAERAAAEYRGALRLFRHSSPSWDPPVVTVSGLEGKGMDAVWSIVGQHRAKLTESGELEEKRRAQQQAWLWSMLDEGLKRHFLARDDVKHLLPEMEAAVASARLTPTEAARRLLALLGGGGEGGADASRPSRRARLA